MSVTDAKLFLQKVDSDPRGEDSRKFFNFLEQKNYSEVKLIAGKLGFHFELQELEFALNDYKCNKINVIASKSLRYSKSSDLSWKYVIIIIQALIGWFFFNLIAVVILSIFTKDIPGLWIKTTDWSANSETNNYAMQPWLAILVQYGSGFAVIADLFLSQAFQFANFSRIIYLFEVIPNSEQFYNVD
jgi:hypothetical protein